MGFFRSGVICALLKDEGKHPEVKEFRRGLTNGRISGVIAWIETEWYSKVDIDRSEWGKLRIPRMRR